MAFAPIVVTPRKVTKVSFGSVATYAPSESHVCSSEVSLGVSLGSFDTEHGDHWDHLRIHRSTQVDEQVLNEEVSRVSPRIFQGLVCADTSMDLHLPPIDTDSDASLCMPSVQSVLQAVGEALKAPHQSSTNTTPMSSPRDCSQSEHQRMYMMFA
jgi:hypothetical protein